jgi:hypothetical protein
MVHSTWTNGRLAELYEDCRARYWSNEPVLRSYRIERGIGDPAQRGWDPDARVIRIDPADHTSDRELCATVLHEMAHVVAGQSAHGPRFWEQIEYLLEQGAPVMLKTGELSGCGATLEAPIPERFVLARQAFEPDAGRGSGNQDGVLSRATGTGRKRRRPYYGE